MVSSNRTCQKNRKIVQPQKMGFSYKKGTEIGFSQENLFSATFIYLTGHQAVKRVKKMGLLHDMDKIYFDAEQSKAKKF